MSKNKKFFIEDFLNKEKELLLTDYRQLQITIKEVGVLLEKYLTSGTISSRRSLNKKLRAAKTLALGIKKNVASFDEDLEELLKNFPDKDR